jgi:cell wall-associated NlpC family hydrolase
MARSVVWHLTADPRGFNRGFKQAEATTRRFSSTVTKTAGLIGGAFAAVQVAGFLKDAITEAREAAKVTRQTNAVIKATGGVAKVSAKDVDRLADALSVKVGVDDEVIAAGQNMLLTFKGVRDEAGKGNDIFRQATTVALDMAAAMNQGVVTQQGLEKANIQLGKALNDPIKGISALTRVGVTFTDAQKEQIKTLVESGKTMDAQKIILKELTSEFGGAAEAAADPWSKLSVVFGNVKEELGTALLPAFEEAAEWLSVALPKAIGVTKEALRDIRAWWDRNKESVETLGVVLVDTFVPGMDEANTSTKDFAEVLEDVDGILTKTAIFGLELVKVWLALEHVTIGLISVFGSLMTAAGHTINVIDKLSGGAGRAGDRFVELGQKAKTQATKELREVRQAAKDAQAAIDKLKGKDIRITGTTSLQFTKSFTASDWTAARLAAGRMAQGGKVPGGWGGGDRVPILAEPGEAVVDKYRTREYAHVLGAMGVPGFALGGKIGDTGVAHTGVGRMMDRWGTLQVAALIKSLVGGAGSPAIKAWIRAQDPKPYIWGAAGPGGFDCSGLVSAVLGKMLGLSGAGSGRRLFTTGTIGAGQYGLRSGLGGTLQIGVTPGRGHMAGRYGGLGFEAESTRTGIKVGAAASRPESFARRYHHMAAGGRITRELLAAYATAAGVEVGGDGAHLRVGGQSFDSGGWLRPGWTMAYNGTGRPERVTPAVTGGDVHVHLHGDVYGDRGALVATIRQGIKDAQRRGGVPARDQLR